MGEKVSLALDERTVQGKKVRNLRRDGLVPAVVYGPGIEPVNVQIVYNVMAKAYKQAGTHAPVNLTINGKKRIAMIKDVEFEPVSGTIQHVSFHAVKADEQVVAEVPVRLVGEGESEAERSGLIVLQTLEKIEVKALPMNLPEAVEVDIHALAEAGDKVTLADAKLPEGVEFIDHESGHGDEEDDEKPRITDLQVASVWEPAALEAANAAAAGTAEDESEVESENGEAEPAAEGDDAEKKPADEKAGNEKSE